MSNPPPPAPPPPPPSPAAVSCALSLEEQLSQRRSKAEPIRIPESASSPSAAPAPLEKTSCLRCGATVALSELRSHETNHSSAILPFLYLGGERNAHNLTELTTRTRVSYILNVSWEAAESYPDQFTYKRIAISDRLEDSQSMGAHFEEAFAFIEEARVRGDRVLVHCVQGISRSATVVVAYLMWHKRISLNRALEHVKRCRPVVNPNPGFRALLAELEVRLGVSEDNRDGEELF